MSKRIKLMLVSMILAVLLISVSSAAAPAWVVSVVDEFPAVLETAGPVRGGGSPS